MKLICTATLVLLNSLVAFAQSSTTARITGTLIDSTSAKPVPFAAIALQTSDEKLITGVITNEKGEFAIEKVAFGTYQLSLTFVGYRSKKLPAFTVSAEKPVYQAGTVLLVADARNLNEVSVVGQKALVEDKGDRLVYNAEKDAAVTGGTAADVLRKVPMLTVDLDGNLKMRGSGNLKILVNGKPSSIMARNPAEAIKQMPANIIKSVEVITSPGAKYDAEGAAGVINIITKKALQGTNGTVNLTGGDLNRSVGGNINIRGKKLGLSVSMNGYQYRNIGDNFSSRTALADGKPINVLEQSSSRDNIGTGGYGEMSLDYDPDSLNRISLSANAWGGNFPMNSSLFSQLRAMDGTIIQDFKRDIQFRNPYGNTEFNLGWTRTYKKPGREFSVLSQYSRMPDNYYYTIIQTPRLSEVPTYLERSVNKSSNNEYTFQTDYIHPFTAYTKHDTLTVKWESGAKIIGRDISSAFTIDQAKTGKETDYILDPERSNEFSYTQRVLSGYSSVRVDTKTKWGLSVGARFEQTQINGDFVSTQTQFKSSYHNLIPSLNLSKTFKEKHTIKASYTQRISRPLIWYLNPFKNYSDPKNVQSGNPYLSPELTHATELAYSTYGKEGSSLSAALFWRQTNNSIEWLSTVDAQGVAFTTPQNIGRSASYGGNVNVSLQPNKKVTISLNTDMSFNSLFSPAMNQRNQGWIWGASPDVSYKFPKDWTVQASGYYGSGGVSLQGRYSGWYYYALSGKKEFRNKKATLTLNLNNPFNRTVRTRAEQFAPTFVSQAYSNYVNRSVRLTFSYKFGSMNAGGNTRQSKKISNDDSKGSR